ncbi:tripartite motif-containing protein 14 [Amia ocellicauda]|uniref:tripartite motif-containing protein 14 n=1 Tax=Amia ocellicauda TaxID=2972642 RepID=UPI0034643AB8
MAEGFSPSEPICSVCQGVSKVPVMLSCWHPFCLACIERVWCQNPSIDHGCPVCLKLPVSYCPAKNPGMPHCPVGVLCDFCLGEKLPALKTCLTCMASFCEDHLRPHLTGETFRSHRLAKPSDDLSGSCCLDHGKPLEMFCRDCKLCVCNVCPILGCHQGHRINIVEQEALEKRNLLKVCLNRMNCKNKQESANVKQTQKAVDDLKALTGESMAWLSQRFTELRLLLDEEERRAKGFVEEQTQAALLIYDEQVRACRERMEVTDGFAQTVQEIYKHDDSVQLLKDFTAAEKEMQIQQQPADQIHPVPLTFDTMHTYVTSFQKALETVLKKPIENRIKNGVTNGPDAKQVQSLMHKTKSAGDKSAFLKYARSPILDPDTLNPRLRLSESRETVSCGWLRKSYPDGPLRFNRLWQVLGRECYFAGRHYWEVDMQRAGKGWWVGAAYRSMSRKGDTEASRLGWNRASWCLKRYDLEYWAFHNGTRTPVLLEEDPERLGVFLDYEAGILSFFDALSGMRRLYTFQAKFTEPVYPAFRLWEGALSFCKLT